MSTNPTLPSLFGHTATVDCTGEGKPAMAETRPAFGAGWRCPDCGMGLRRVKGKAPVTPAHGTRPSWIGNPNPGLGGR